MESRMDRYKVSDEKYGSTYSRSNKNKELYQNLGNNTKYTNFTDVSRIDAVTLDDAKKNYRTREGYKTIKEYGEIKPKLQKELEDINYLYKDQENKVYDINSVIKNAKENRKEIDEMEAKRKLKNTNYNILASLNKEELEKYINEKKERTKVDKDNLRGLIDTITSKTLAGEISKEAGVDLLNDLMATSAMDKVSPADDISSDVKLEEEKQENKKEVVDEKISKADLVEVNKKKEDYKSNTNSDIMRDIDKSFYTKSMDLSDKDFDLGDIDEKKVPVIVKVLLILILLSLIAVGVFFIIKKI